MATTTPGTAQTMAAEMEMETIPEQGITQAPDLTNNGLVQLPCFNTAAHLKGGS